MNQRPADALLGFIEQIPERLVKQVKKNRLEFDVTHQGESVNAIHVAPNGRKSNVEIDFDPLSSLMTRCTCSCAVGRKGSICKHITGLVLQLVDEMSPQQLNDPLEYLEKYLGGAAIGESHVRLAVQISEQMGQLLPEIHVERPNSDGDFARVRRFTANDSYKLTHVGPYDQHLLEYLKNFRQVVFYSSYPSAKKYPWGFWLSLLGHPRVYWDDKRVKVSQGDIDFRFEERDDRFHVCVVPKEISHADISVYAVDGGLMFVDHLTAQMVVCQVDPFRLQIVRETIEARPALTRNELMRNIQRLERLQSLFNFELPALVEASIAVVAPSLVLMLELNPLDGLVLKPRIQYEGVSERLAVTDDAIYLVSQAGQLIRRNHEQEEALFERFRAWFPIELGTVNADLIQIRELDQAFSALEALKKQRKWSLEWLKRKPRVNRIEKQPRLRLHTDTHGFLRIFLTTEDQEFELDVQSLSDLNSLSSNYVAVGDHEWLQINAQLRNQLGRLKLAVQPDGSKSPLKNAAIPILSDLEDIEWSGAGEFQKKIERWRNLGDQTFDPSPKLNAELRSYQLEGYRWLRRMSDLEIGVCLADDMGLGKTIQGLAILLDRVPTGPALIVAPASVVFNWREEIERFAPSLNAVIYAEDGRGKRLGRLKLGDIVIVSYALLLRDIEMLAKRVWGTLVLDEAQFIKNALSQTAQAATQLKRKWTLALTGTPLENHLGELWSIFRMVDPAVLGDWSTFRQNFMTPIEKNRDRERMEALRLMIRPFILRRTKSEVLSDLPDRTEIIVKVEMTDSQRTRYLEERNRILRQVDDNAENLRLRLLTGILRLRQLACHPSLVDERYKGESSKLALFSQLVQEVASESHRALVFSQFTSFLDLISKELNRIRMPYLTMTGETPVKHRQGLIKRFQDGEVPVFLVSLRAGGTGINLTHANYVFHMDPWWNPAVEDQATDRAHRIGQTEAVTVYRLIAKETIEEAMLKIHDRKKEIVNGLLAGHDQPSRLTVDDMIALIQGN